MGASHSGPDIQGPAFEPTTGDDPASVSGHRISARLGTSALGRVYFAHAPGGQPVALTVVHPERAARDGFAARFHHDAQDAGRVQAPGAVPVLGSGQEGGRFWIATAFVPALPLDRAVDGTGPLPTRVVLRLVAGLAETLQALHHAGVVHGDLRPAHVLLAADGPKATGYGLAALAAPAADGTAEGTGPAFLAPEQAAGKPAVPATDVFALGQVAAYASIGRPPFDAPARIQQDEPDLNELPGELREIVTRCLIKEPGLRPSLAQVTAMCAQAVPAGPRPDTWLPPALLAAIVPAMPAPAPPHPAIPPAPAPPTPPAGGPVAPPQTPAPTPGGPVAVPQPPTAVPRGPVAASQGQTAAPGGPVAPAPAAGAPAAVPQSPTALPGGPVGSPQAPPAGPGASAAVPQVPIAAPGTPVARPPAAPPGPAPGGLPTAPGATPGGPVPMGPAPVPGGSPPCPPAGLPAGAPPAGPQGPPPGSPGAPPAPGVPAPVPAPGGPVPGPPPGGPVQAPLPGGGAPVPPPGAPAPGGLHWPHRPQFPHIPHLSHFPHLAHLPLVRPRRRTAGVAAAAVGLVVAVTAGITLAGGLGGSGRDDARGKGFGATAPAAAPTSSVPQPGGTPSASATPTDPTGQGDPAAGEVYPGIRLPSGNSLALHENPPSVQPDASGGAFGFSADGQSFVAEAHQAHLTVLDPGLPPTAEACRTDTGPQLTSVPRHALSPGSGRVCVRLVDGTIALVTLRQITPPAASLQYAVIDVTVWRLVDQSAESDL
ncbi:protein kinase [Streptomyces sp. NPDC020917]|uniref:serine/threonine-protein kinase n=1 Tax=Streptomyces sp. NPDC020917 TaxID=3365102 RepID=UPI00378C4E00